MITCKHASKARCFPKKKTSIMTIRYEEHVPSPKEYCDMRIKAGLSPKSLKAAEIGLPNSLYGVSVRDEGKLIAMGRVVGDGACNFEIVDVDDVLTHSFMKSTLITEPYKSSHKIGWGGKVRSQAINDKRRAHKGALAETTGRLM